jgi:hypothetical protein
MARDDRGNLNGSGMAGPKCDDGRVNEGEYRESGGEIVGILLYVWGFFDKSGQSEDPWTIGESGFELLLTVT